MTPVDHDTGDRLLTAEEAASLAGVKRRTWHRMLARGSAPPADGHVGRTPVWLESTVTAWLGKRRRAA